MPIAWVMIAPSTELASLNFNFPAKFSKVNKSVSLSLKTENEIRTKIFEDDALYAEFQDLFSLVEISRGLLK
jgi:hypothetical protein